MEKRAKERLCEIRDPNLRKFSRYGRVIVSLPGFHVLQFIGHREMGIYIELSKPYIRLGFPDELFEGVKNRRKFIGTHFAKIIGTMDLVSRWSIFFGKVHVYKDGVRTTELTWFPRFRPTRRLRVSKDLVLLGLVRRFGLTYAKARRVMERLKEVWTIE